MNLRKHYIVKPNPKAKYSWDKFIVIPEGEEYDETKYYTTHENEAEALADIADRNSHYYTSDYDDNEIKDFFNSIDFKPLETRINEKLGNFNLTFKNGLENGRNGWRVLFESNEDLCTFGGLLSKMLLSCYISQFSSGLYADKLNGELKVWMTITFDYKHFSGGTNGCELCTVWYSKKDGWTFIFEDDRYEANKRNV